MPAADRALADARGFVHRPASGEVRIVSLVPSITELLCDLGLSRQIVGRTGFCIHPWQTVRRIPKVGGTKSVNLERVRELRPSHAIVNVDENLKETAEALEEFVPNVVVTHPLRPSDNLALYRLFGALFDRTGPAESLCRAFEEAMDRTRRLQRPAQRVLYLIWREPWMTIAPETYIAAMLALFNWRVQPSQASERYPVVELDALAGEVDRVLLSSEPYHFKEADIPPVAAALPDAEVTLIDGEMTSWYGSRAIEALAYMADLTGGPSASA